MDIQKEVPMIVDWPATWSKILIFLTCHWRFWLQEGSKFVTGKADIPFATNRAMQLGEAKHDLYEKAARSYIQGKGTPENVDLNPLWNPYIGSLIWRLIGVYSTISIEEKIGISSDWRAWSLGKYWNPDKVAFGNKKMLLRTKMDLVLLNTEINPTHAVIADYKSGKARKQDTYGQLALYALVAFCKWPTLQRVDCVYIFVDHNKRQEEFFLRSQYDELKTYFIKQILEIQHYLKDASIRIPAGDCTPGNCHWCPATKEQCDEK